MAAPAFGAAGTQFQGSPGTTVSVDVPDGVVADSIIVITAFVDTPTATITALPAGFANAADSPVAGGSNRLYVFWKRATGSESTAGTYDYTTSASVYNNAQAIRYDGAITSGDPWDVTASAIDNTSGTVTPAVSDTSTVADILWVFAGTDWAGGTWTPPTSYAERRDSGDGVCTVADLAQASPGSSGSITATCTGSDRRTAWLGALKSPTAAVESGSYSQPRLPGRIGPDGKVYLPLRFDNNGGAAPSTDAPAGVATVDGAAPQPAASVGAQAGNATVAGSAPQPTVVTGTLAPAGVATVTGNAPQPTVTIQPNAGNPTVAGSAPQPEGGVSPSAGISTVTGAAPQPTAAIAAKAGQATVNGAAPQPVVVTGTIANAGLASVSGAAPGPSITLRVNAGASVVAGVASPASGGVSALAGTATVTPASPSPRAGVGVQATTAEVLAQAFGVTQGVLEPLDVVAAGELASRWRGYSLRRRVSDTDLVPHWQASNLDGHIAGVGLRRHLRVVDMKGIE